MNSRREMAAIIVIIVLAIMITGITAYDLLGGTSAQRNSTTSDSFIQQPVVDIIIPSLFSQTSTGGVNLPLNLTLGESFSLTVDVYSTVFLNASLEFITTLLTSSTGGVQAASGQITGTFDPSILVIGANGKGITTFHVQVSQTANVGNYSTVISVVNAVNSTQVWGDIFQIHVTE